jgi:hypothetical protein
MRKGTGQEVALRLDGQMMMMMTMLYLLLYMFDQRKMCPNIIPASVLIYFNQLLSAEIVIVNQSFTRPEVFREGKCG